jgi:DNA-damage-inducible protein J
VRFQSFRKKYSGNNAAIPLHCSYTKEERKLKRGKEMIANTVVRARIDEKTKAEATAVLAAIGLTLSDAVRLMLMRVAAEKALPFDPLIPNAETIEAIMESQRGELIAVGSREELFRVLNEED